MYHLDEKRINLPEKILVELQKMGRKFELSQIIGRIIDRYMNVIKKLIDVLSEFIPAEALPDFKVPESFVNAVKKSGMSLDSFVQKVKNENSFGRDEDIFLYWDRIKEKYTGRE